ncbi:MAG TPA: nucleotidyltransferase family protein [Anaerolineae bacterium]|nr:nucleotidyltransferase family protein [Anaerolineae bacterium]
MHPSPTDAVLMERLVRLCLRSRWDVGARASVAAMMGAGEVNWTAVVAWARESRVTPLLYDALRGQDAVPPDVLGSLRAGYDRTFRYNLYLFGELQKVLRRLNAAAVPVIILKGAALAQVVYGNLALRPLRDLDLLVPQDAVPRVERIVKELGYGVPRVEAQPGAALAFESQLKVIKFEPLFAQIEIHWSLIDSPFYQNKLASEWFWETAVALAVRSESARMLGPEAQILYLCAHLLLHHGGANLLWLNDVAEVIRWYGAVVDWEELVKQAQALRLTLPAQMILTQVAEEWGAPLPAEVVVKLRELPVTSAESRVARALTTLGRSPIQRLWDDLWSLPSWKDRLRFAWINLFPSRDYMRQRYGAGNPFLVALAYPYRWWLGVQTFGTRFRK